LELTNVNNQKNDTSLLDRLNQKLPLYEMPHFNDVLNSKYKVGMSSFLESDEKIFVPDQNFINKINQLHSNSKSPWKAKAHDIFQNKTHKHMKTLLGLNTYKL
jgi:hypothetical protein